MELKANELRIGNYVYFKHCDYDKDIPIKVNYTCVPNLLGLEKISVNRIEYNNIEPILLNKDWILGFGFTQTDLNGFEIETPIFKIEFNGSLYCFLKNKPINIKYVHQLQNLYFSLTSVELTRQKIN